MSKENGGGEHNFSLPDSGGTFSYLLRIIAGKETGVAAAGIRGGLRVLSWIYLGALNATRLAHRVGVRRCVHAPCPIISVGNLSSGGTGKSTATAAIAGWLREAGLRPAVLSRGYGARGNQPVRVVFDGEQLLLSPEVGGDEPVMLARRLTGVPVLIGRCRPVTVRAAVEQFGVDACILDDGSQVWNLAKDLEIMLLDCTRAFDNGFVLPRGLLREPPSHLRRADAVVLMDPERAHPETLAALRRQVRALASGAVIAEACRVPEQLRDAAAGAVLPLSRLRDLPVVALSAIGNPGGFEALLRAQGARVTPARLPDHHRYTAADLESVLQFTRRVNAAVIVTTEKDYVKLKESIDRQSPQYVQILVLSIRLQFLAGEAALRERVLAAAARTTGA